ncbi:MAG: ARMT1-like domain-containing protein [Thermoflexaceae bacterium]|nr:ARMT1-like domain-containing protein [Thermoflexaceae bacterium]
MRIIESCAECLYDKQKHLTEDERYLKEIKDIIDNRGEDDTSPYLVYRFNKVYQKYFGRQTPYQEIKKKYNDLVLSMEDSVRNRIEASEDPLAKALLYARVGNYIDFGAMNHVDEETFLSLLDRVEWNDKDLDVIQSFVDQCKRARNFLLIADNCGEIVLDKLFLEQLHKSFPDLEINILVRGGEVLNDATEEDAEYVGINELARIISNGLPIAGTVYDMLPDGAKEVVNQADVILAKGQGNYESLSKQGRHIFYSFLCKCELFTSRFGVPKLTGIFVEEWD